MAASPALLLLETVYYTTESDLESLRKLVGANGEVLNQEIVFRILLTFLPESTEPSIYIGLLADLVAGNLSALDEADLPEWPGAQLKEEDARQRAQDLWLLPLYEPAAGYESSSDALTAFLLARAHRVEAETGSLVLVQQLVEPFGEHSLVLRRWLTSILLPLIRLEYEYHPLEVGAIVQAYSLPAFESLRQESGLRSLLEEIGGRASGAEAEVWVQDLRGIVAPWIFGEILRTDKDDQTSSGLGNGENSETTRTSKDLWNIVNDWLLRLAQKDFTHAIPIFLQWDGPQDMDSEARLDSPKLNVTEAWQNYLQTAMAMLYMKTPQLDSDPWPNYDAILQKVNSAVRPNEALPSIIALDMSVAVQRVDNQYLESISAIYIFPHELLDVANPLTRPNPQTVLLAFHILSSSYILSTIGEDVYPDTVLSLSLHGFEADQRTRMQKILHLLAVGSSKSDSTWLNIRQKILWLRDWTPEGQNSEWTRNGFFCRLSYKEIEVEILKALVTAARFKLVKDLYLDHRLETGPSNNQMRRAILDVMFRFYDNASNGNKTRGGIKKAADIVSTFRPYFPQSVEFAEASALIQATHALSFYALTLQHGVPFVPVNIRVHSNTLSLIDKALSQNAGSYTKLDDLLDIGRNFVKAGLVKSIDNKGLLHPQGESDLLLAVERHVIALAIGAALREGDFDTAYSYIVNRLSPSEHMPQNGESHISSSDNAVLWQAAYQAGRYQPKSAPELSNLRRLEQRMELLSQALLLAPPASLRDVLATWRECEEEVNASLAEESEEEERWNEKGDRHLPGGFTSDDVVPTPHQPRNAARRAMDEETPMGLFEVARGAASAFSKSAFPLRGQAAGTSAPARTIAPDLSGEKEEQGGNEQGERVRKRDMVSSMVTGGLASGIGWVIGAPGNRPE